MLERIAEIKGIGFLHDANGKSFTCEKATFIYSDNGRGKSTLASVLRSVSSNASALILHRKTIDGTSEPQVTLQFGSGHKVTFNGAVWSEQRPDVLVFDSDFIEQNVHSGGAVTTGQRKNLLDFALGDAAVNARDVVDDRLALADRFGLKLGFQYPDQAAYLDMVSAYAAHFALDWDSTDALAFAHQRGGRSGRVAWHYAVELAGRAGRNL